MEGDRKMNSIMITKIFIPVIIFILLSGIALALPEKEGVAKENQLAGITLGFSMDQVKRILGEPQFVSDLQNETTGLKQLVWEYKNKGIKILFSNEQADVIIIQKPCTIPTPRGLQIGDNWRKSLDLYRYCSAYVQNMGYQIGIVFTLEKDLKLSIAIPSDGEDIITISLWREKGDR
jgi:hypothetical protein